MKPLRLCLSLLLACIGASVAWPATHESICTGGRADVFRCFDFETLTNCGTGTPPGYSDPCWQDNGYPSNGTIGGALAESQFRIVSEPGAAVGTGYTLYHPRVGTTGAHGNGGRWPGQNFLGGNYRFYRKFSKGYLSFGSGHGPGLLIEHPTNTNLQSIAKFQNSQTTNDTYFAGTCAAGSVHIPPNIVHVVTEHNQWHTVEMEVVMDNNHLPVHVLTGTMTVTAPNIFTCTSCGAGTGFVTAGFVVGNPEMGVKAGANFTQAVNKERAMIIQSVTETVLTVRLPGGIGSLVAEGPGTRTLSSVEGYDGDGILKVWVDGTLVSNYSNLNYGHTTDGCLIVGWILPSDYHHVMIPPWRGELAFDNAVVTNHALGCPGGNCYIGPAVGENPRGTPDSLSPYIAYNAYEAWLGRRAGPDCDPNAGTLGAVGAFPFPYNIATIGSTPSTIELSTVQTHGLFIDRCVTPVPEKSLLVTVKTSGLAAGTEWFLETPSNTPQLVNYGWVYLPTPPTFTTLALSGFSNYFDGNDDYIGFGVTPAGKWALLRNIGGTRGVIATASGADSDATFNGWHEFEIILWNDQKVSLAIDKKRLFTKQVVTGMDTFFGQMFPVTAGGLAVIVVGMLDFQGTVPYSVYIDDTAISSVSYWSCDAWDVTNCPVAPGAPTGLKAQ